MVARKRSNPKSSTTNTKGDSKMAERGTLGSLQMIEVDDAELDAARGGRGHGEYDTFLDTFLAADIRGTKVGFDGVKSQSIKTGLKSAIERAVKAGKVTENELQVRGKDEAVYLVRAASTDEA